MRRLVVALAIVVAFSAVSNAATLSTLNGDVLVNTGNGFGRAAVGQPLKPGDRVMVGRNGGDATISYDLSCLERVQVGRIVVVQTGIPCNAPGANTTPAPLGSGIATETLLIGAGAAAGAGAIIYFATKGSSP